jgi:SPP1 gp7 family putative phage head morphogenesis protein
MAANIHALAMAYVQDLRIAERLAKPGLVKAMGQLARAIRTFVRKNKKLPSIVDYVRYQTGAVKALSTAMAYAHMLGDNRTRKNVEGLTIALDLTATIRGTYREANAATLEYIRLRYETRAVDILKGSSEYIEIRLRNRLADSFSEGVPIDTIINDLTDELSKAGVIGVSDHAIEAIARTQTQIAFNAGKYTAETDPEIAAVLWGYTLATVGDARVREEHALVDGVTLPKEDPFWKTNYPPNGWNCRCQVIPLFDSPDIRKPPTEYKGPDKGFIFNPGELFSGIE